jgi:hypothetical protein
MRDPHMPFRRWGSAMISVFDLTVQALFLDEEHQ